MIIVPTTITCPHYNHLEHDFACLLALCFAVWIGWMVNV